MSAVFCAWRKVWHHRFVVSCRLVRYKSIQQYQLANSKQVSQHLNNPPNVLLNYATKCSILYFQACVNFVKKFCFCFCFFCFSFFSFIFFFVFVFLPLYQLLHFQLIPVIFMILSSFMPPKCCLCQCPSHANVYFLKSFKTIIISKHITIFFLFFF